MKANEFIVESGVEQQRELLGEYFHGEVDELTDKDLVQSPHGLGLDVYTNLYVNSGVRFDHIPVKLATTKGDLSIERDVGLKSLKNFPRIAGSIFIRNNADLTSVETNYQITCTGAFVIDDCGIIDLNECNVVVPYMRLINNSKLQSLRGLTGHVGRLILENNPDLADMNLLKYVNISQIHFLDLDTPKLKLCQLIVMDVSKKMRFPEVSPELRDIIKKYQGAGPKAYVPLLNDLKDAGFGQFANRG